MHECSYNPLGVDRFLDTLPEMDAFRRRQLNQLIQLANQQGFEYPQTPAWPTTIESTEVLEAFQNLGRRIAEGNADGNAEMRVRIAAQQLQKVLNIRLNPISRTWESIKTTWPLVATVLLVTVSLYFRATQRNQRDASLALLLARAKLHSQLHMYERVLNEFSDEITTNLSNKLSQYSERITRGFSKHMRHLTNDASVAIGVAMPWSTRIRTLFRHAPHPYIQRRKEIKNSCICCSKPGVICRC